MTEGRQKVARMSAFIATKLGVTEQGLFYLEAATRSVTGWSSRRYGEQVRKRLRRDDYLDAHNYVTPQGRELVERARKLGAFSEEENRAPWRA